MTFPHVSMWVCCCCVIYVGFRKRVAFGLVCGSNGHPETFGADNMRFSLWLASVAACAALAACMHDLTLHRLVQYDTIATIPPADEGDGDAPPTIVRTRFGGVQASFGLLAAVARPEDDFTKDRNMMLNKNVVLLRPSEVSTERIKAIVDGRRAGALLFLLPGESTATQVRFVRMMSA